MITTEPIAADITVGMPQTNSLGLSENWLLKEAGDRHWAHLASTLGQRAAEMRDAQGRRVYAAFTQVHLREARLGEVGEGDALTLRLRGARVGRSQHYSGQTLLGANGAVAQLEMLSVFVARECPGDNHSVVRVAMPGATSADSEEGLACAEAARAVRAGLWHERFGVDAAAPALMQQTLRPCPSNDFNGAGLLYFANFQALVDRCHWEWGLAEAQPRVRERQMVFHGSLNVGETLELHLRANRRTGVGNWSWTQLRRGGDGKLIADVATHRS